MTLKSKNLGFVQTLRRTGVLFAAVGLLASISAAAQDRQARVELTIKEGTNMAVAVSPDGRTIAVDLQGRLWVLPSSGGIARAITSELDEARYPAWSPDGTWVAFQSYTDDNWNIWVVRPDGSESRQLTFGPHDDREASWSPDGKRLAFSSDRSGNYDLWQVTVGTGELRRITTDPSEDFYPAWSPDGKKIAFVSRRGGRFGLYLKEMDGEAQPSGGREFALISSSAALALPSWRGDSRQVSYYSSESGNRLLAVDVPASLPKPHVDPDEEESSDLTSSPKTLTDPDEDVFVSRVSWLSEQEFVYTADGQIKRRRVGKTPQPVPFEAMFVLQRDTTYPLKDHQFKSTEPRPVKGILGPVVSPDGKQIIFTALGNLWLRGEKPEPVRVTNDPYMDIDPAWSPDGRRIAYLSDRRGTGTMDLWIRDMKTGQEGRVTETEENLRLPTWSPDGRRIAVYMQDSRDWHSSTPYVVDVETREMHKVHEWIFLPGQLNWSADGKTLAVSTLHRFSTRDRKGANEILLISLEGHPDRFVTPVPMESLGMRAGSNLCWSPDGRRMAYVYDGLLWVVPVSPGGDLVGPPHRLTNDLAESPSWTGDSKSLVYLATDRLKRVSLEDGRIEEIPLNLTWQPAQPTGRKVVRAGRLFDGVSPQYRRDVDIVIEGNEIKEIVPRRNDWENAEIIDASNKTVAPGMFESHIHQFAVNGERTGRILMSYGITSVREPGANPYEALEAKEAWASGARVGPREFFSDFIEGARIFYPMSIPISAGAALDLEMERASRLGYDLIKTYERLSDPLQRRVIESAHKIGIPVSSHDLYPAVSYSIDAVEHVNTTDRRDSLEADRLSPGGRIYDDVRKLVAKSGIIIVPTTLAAFFPPADFSPISVPQFAKITPARYQGVFAKRNPWVQAELDAEARAVREFSAAGARIVAGTDSSFFGSGLSLILTMQHYVEGGLTPYQALQSATQKAAELSGVADQLGSIAPGKLADLVVVDGDPLSNIMDLVKVDTVIKNGQRYDLEKLLAGPQRVEIGKKN